MTNTKKQNALFTIIILFSVVSYVFINFCPSNVIENFELVYTSELEEISNSDALLAEIQLVKEVVSRAMDILGSNF